MFVQAIEEVSRFTTPLHTIERSYGSQAIRAGAGTMFFVNDEGVAVTCNHVASLIPYADNLNRKFFEFKAKRAQFGDQTNHKKVKELARQYGFENDQLCEMLIQLNCAASFDAVEVTPHPKYDLAIVRLINPKHLSYSSYAKFPKPGTEVKQGSYLCRLGYPFPEFQNFTYDAPTDSIQWTQQGIIATPRFPIEGMVTRHLADENGIFGIEMSTPGLKGQSGGPLFDRNGMVCGMQYATNHLHLGFDMKNQEVLANGQRIRVSHYQPFLHVGWCIHAEVIKSFLKEKGVRYFEV